MSMKQNQYICEQCNSKDKQTVLTFCCYRILCFKCQASKHLKCQYPLRLFTSNNDYAWCSRCSIKKAKIQCSQCKNKNFCHQCSMVLHKLYPKFQRHSQSIVSPQGGQKCQKHLIKKNLQNNKGQILCCLCMQKFQTEQNPDAILNALEQIKVKIQAHSSIRQSQEFEAKQIYNQLQSEIKNSFRQIQSILQNVKNNLFHQINFKRQHCLKNINQNYKISIASLIESQNIMKLAKSNDNRLKNFLASKTRILLANIHEPLKILPIGNYNIKIPFNQIKQTLKNIDFSKAFVKQKKNKQPLAKMTKSSFSSSVLNVFDKKGNSMIAYPQIKSKQQNYLSILDVKETKSINNDEQSKSDMPNDDSKKLTKIKSDKILRTYLLGKDKFNRLASKTKNKAQNI